MLHKQFVRAIFQRSARKINVQTRKITTVDHNEVERFAQLASNWWDENGPLKALHSMNRVRIPWIRDTLRCYGDKTNSSEILPLKNLSILDVGCGAGILCEPLSRLDATVVGLDVVEENIRAAEAHETKNKNVNSNLRYFVSTVEDFAEKSDEKFDAVVASEVLEHVSNRELFLKSCLKLLKPKGILFITTLNRTILSKIFAIYMAENVFKIVPEGVHDWDKFVSPESLEMLLERENCTVRMLHGLCYNPLTNYWRWIRDTSINYGLHAVKN